MQEEKTYCHIYEKNVEDYISLPNTDLISFSYEELKVITRMLVEFYKDNIVDNEDTVVFFGFTFRDIVGNTKRTRNKRLTSFSYIFKKLSKRKESYTETILFKRLGGDYCTDSCVETHRAKKAQRESYLRDNYIDFGNVSCNMLELAELAQQSKMSEIYMVNKILEVRAAAEGRAWMMITLTAPGVFHINPVNGKGKWKVENSPLECDKFLTRAYRAAYYAIKKDVEREKLTDLYGAWSKEPHKSGAVHMHVLVYLLPSEIERYKTLFTNALRNAFKRIGERFYKGTSVNFKTQDKDFIEYDNEGNITKRAGSGASYLFKYIMKSLNIMEYKPEGQKRIKIENSDKISAHNSFYNYKRFSFVGVKNCLSKWRVVRQIAKHLKYTEETKEEYTKPLQIVFKGVLENDFKLFSEISDNIELVYDNKLNCYDEETATVIGFKADGEYFEKPSYNIEYKPYLGVEGV